MKDNNIVKIGKSPVSFLASQPSPNQNYLLSALTAIEFIPLVSKLELVELRLGDILYEPGSQLQHAYFPTTSIVSLHYVTESGSSSETACVGNDGVVGISFFLGDNITSGSAMVQTTGHAYRLDRHMLRAEFHRSGIVQRLLLLYTQSLATQISQTAVCNRHHSIEQQLCRWLLTTLDRLPSLELTMTQELLGNMLGVRREGITKAAGDLQRAGIIIYRRGHISILDRAGLKRHSCECYAVVKAEHDRLRISGR
jgi:CRP-like cAMP-binding protein